MVSVGVKALRMYLEQVWISIVRANKAKGSVKTRRKCAGRDPKFLLEILQLK